MCQGGHVRSVAVKFLLHYVFGGHDVLACGWQSNTEETRKMLFEWADLVVIMDKDFSKFVPPEFRKKLVCYHVGPDRFGSPFHPGLQKMLRGMITQHFQTLAKAG
jgi:hypothetical protein